MLVVSTGDLEDISLEVLSKSLSFDFVRDTLVIEGTKLAFIIDFQDLLQAGRRIGDVKLKSNRNRNNDNARTFIAGQAKQQSANNQLFWIEKI